MSPPPLRPGEPGTNWSRSLHTDLEVCLRRIYYRVWGSWGGWKEDSGVARLIYLGKKAQTLRGHATFRALDLIRELVGRIADHEDVSPERITEVYLKRLEAGFRSQVRYSASKQWAGHNPSRAPLILHDHLVDDRVTAQDIEAAIGVIRELMTGFCTHLPWLTELMNQAEDWAQHTPVDAALGSSDFGLLSSTQVFGAPDLVLGGGRAIVFGAGSTITEERAALAGVWTEMQGGFTSTVIGVPLKGERQVFDLGSRHGLSLRATALRQIQDDISRLATLRDPGIRGQLDAFPGTPYHHDCAECTYRFYCHTTHTPASTVMEPDHG